MTHQTSTCSAPLCSYSVPAALAECPDCGRQMLSSRSVRRRGLIMLTAGGFIFCLMSAIAYALTPLLTSASFTGSPEQARTILQFFWVLIAFGGVGTVAGGWQVATGRRNRLVTTGMLALAGLVVIAARATDLALSLPGA